MVGDINICYLTNMYGSEEYLNILYSNRIINTIQGPTRVEFLGNNLVSSCLDHINIRSDNDSFNSFILEDKIADHYWTGIVLPLRPNMPGRCHSYGPERNLIKTEPTMLSNKKVSENINKENWDTILELLEPDDIYNNITNKFNSIYSNSRIKINHKTYSGKNIIPWMNEELKALIDHKQYLWNQWKRDKYNINKKRLFKAARNNLTYSLRKAKQQYFSKLLTNNVSNTRKTWDIINQFLNKQKRPSVLENIKSSFKLNTDDQITDKANQFQSYFKNIIEDINTEMLGEPFEIKDYFNYGNYDIGSTVSMNFITINDQNLKQVITKLNSNSSAGPDNIRPSDIKDNIAKLGPIIIHLINRIIVTGKIPKQMKITSLRPIFKTGNKGNIACYRPIGSISVLTKVLEHHICEQLKKYLVANQVIHEAQHGFMPNKSTIDLLEVMSNDINKALDQNNFVLAVATDLTKAFDLVDYKIMLNKLKKTGVGGKLLNLFQDYFTDRRLMVNIGSYTSNDYDQKCGLIQGSILSPILFNIYVNDLASLNFKSNVLQYADDNIFYIIHKDINIATSYMQRDLNLMVKYFFNNSIKLNIQKTKAIVFKNPRVNFILQNPLELICHSHICFKTPGFCACQPLTFQQDIKHLGVVFDNHMRFYSHLTYLKSKMKFILYKCSRLSIYFPISTKRIIYFSLVQSMFYYGISIYYVAPQYILSPLKQILNRIIKVLFHGLSPALVGIMQFESLAKFTVLVRNFSKEHLRSQENVDYNLRRRQFIVMRHSNAYGSSTLEYRIPTIFNTLPEELKWETNKSKFKNKLKIHLLNQLS